MLRPGLVRPGPGWPERGWPERGWPEPNSPSGAGRSRTRENRTGGSRAGRNQAARGWSGWLRLAGYGLARAPRFFYQASSPVGRDTGRPGLVGVVPGGPGYRRGRAGRGRPGGLEYGEARAALAVPRAGGWCPTAPGPVRCVADWLVPGCGALVGLVLLWPVPPGLVPGGCRSGRGQGARARSGPWVRATSRSARGRAGCWASSLGGMPRQGLARLALAGAELAGWGLVTGVRAAGLRLVRADQPGGGGDREPAGDHYHADDGRPAVRPPAAAA